MTNEDILKALGNVQEPDLGKDLVTLNMVKDIVIDGMKVSFTYSSIAIRTLTCGAQFNASIITGACRPSTLREAED